MEKCFIKIIDFGRLQNEEVPRKTLDIFDTNAFYDVFEPLLRGFILILCEGSA